MDEISPLGLTEVREARDGAVHRWTIDPAAFGVGAVSAESLAGGDPAQNAEIIEAVLQGAGSTGAQAAVLLNAAAALYVSRDDLTYADAVAQTRSALAAGVGYTALERLRAASQRWRA